MDSSEVTLNLSVDSSFVEEKRFSVDSNANSHYCENAESVQRARSHRTTAVRETAGQAAVIQRSQSIQQPTAATYDTRESITVRRAHSTSSKTSTQQLCRPQSLNLKTSSGKKKLRISHQSIERKPPPGPNINKSRRNSADKSRGSNSVSNPYHHHHHHHHSKMQFSYKDLHRTSEQEKIKEHIHSAFQLAKIISDFVNKFSRVYENFSRELHGLVDAYKQRTSEYSRGLEGSPYEQSSLKTAWDTLLQEILTDVKSYDEFANNVEKSGPTRLTEIVACKKLQMNEMYNFKQEMDCMLDESEESLHKLRVQLRKENHLYDEHRKHFTVDGVERRDKAFAECALTHNKYVLELNSANRLMDESHSSGLPWVLDELENVHKETCSAVNFTIQNLALFAASKARDQVQRYDGIFSICKQVNVTSDISNFVRATLSTKLEMLEDNDGSPKHRTFNVVLSHPDTPECLQKGDIIFDHALDSSIQSKKLSLLAESAENTKIMAALEETIASLQNTHQRLLANNCLNPMYSVQADLCRHKKQLHLNKLKQCVLLSQMESLTLHQVEFATSADKKVKPQKSSSKNESSIKSMWRKLAKKVAKKPEESEDIQSSGSNSAINGSSIAPDESESDVMLPTRHEQSNEREGSPDPIYHLLKGASMMRKGGDGDSSGVSSMKSLPRQNTASSGKSGSSRSSSPAAASRPVVASGMRPRQMLNRRMKSFSLDTPDAPKPVDQSTKMKSSSYTNNTCIPGCNLSPANAKRRQLQMSQNRGLSVDLEDAACSSYDNSNSSLHSTHSSSPKHTRSKPTTPPDQPLHIQTGDDVYIALYDYIAKAQDELTLRAGERVIVSNMGDPDWWFGSVDGYFGYFPQPYVQAFAAGQKFYKTLKSLQLRTGNSDVKLFMEQVVTSNGKEERGSINITTKDLKSGKTCKLACPLMYLREI